MKNGRIIAYSNIVNAGVIKTADGTRFSFARSDWQSPVDPKNDMAVNFNGDKQKAREVSVSKIAS